MKQEIRRNKSIGDNIKTKRMLKKLTQEQVAVKVQLFGCDMSRGTYAKIEAGLRHLSAEELEAIKTVLNMDYKDFFAK